MNVRRRRGTPASRVFLGFQVEGGMFRRATAVTAILAAALVGACSAENDHDGPGGNPGAAGPGSGGSSSGSGGSIGVGGGIGVGGAGVGGGTAPSCKVIEGDAGVPRRRRTFMRGPPRAALRT